MKNYIFIIVSIIISTNLFSQTYFQQEVNYKIDVTLIDTSHTLIATEEIEYTNNSTDTLKFLYFHLWPNAYKNTETAFAKQKIKSGDLEFYQADTSEYGEIYDLDFSVNDNQIKWELDEEFIDIAILHLNKPLLPKEKIIIKTPFKVKIPESFSRLGHVETSYQITQWYPKPAVYDLNGWHQMPYLDQGEFYSEFGNFDVSITLPKNYVVGGSGNLQNESEMKFLDSLAEAGKSNPSYWKTSGFPKSSEQTKTIKYKLENAHDFAWFADKRFKVQKGTITLPHSFRKVNTWIMYTKEEADLWKDAVIYVNDAVKYYSLWNGDYPYDNCTAVYSALSAGGGMEYPTITVIGDAQNNITLEQVIMHEVGHNWFYGILGSNEREFPWMDEGMNSFNELRYMETKYPKLTLSKEMGIGNVNIFGLADYKQRHMYYLSYMITALWNLDQPISLSSEEFAPINYGAIVYMKTAFAFYNLYSYLGEEKYDKAMQNYFEKWKFKHPQPNDVKKCFEESTGEDLSWFFNDIFETKKKVDYKTCKLKRDKSTDTYKLSLKNKTGVQSPCSYSLIKNDSIISTTWFAGFDGKKDFTVNTTDFDRIVIDKEIRTLDIYSNNNGIRRKGLLKKTEPIKLRFLGGIPKQNRNDIFWLPAMGWNNYNGFMSGIALYSNTLFINKFEYYAVPMYSWGNQQFAGSGRFAYNIFPSTGIINRYNIFISANQYSLTEDNNYQRYKAGVNLYFDRKDYSNRTTNKISFNTVVASDPIQLIYSDNLYDYTQFFNINWSYKNNRTFNPYFALADLEMQEDYAKISAEIDYTLNYSEEKTGLDIRLFGGAFLYNNSDYGLYNFNVSGTCGIEDYQYSNLLLARSNDIGTNFWSQQYVDNQAGFAIYTPLSSNKWMMALNIKSTLWFRSPLMLYANFATYDGAGKTWKKSQTIAWETGLQFNVIKNVFYFYFPVFYSSDIEITNQFYSEKYIERVRFVLKLDLVNPSEMVGNIIKNTKF